MVLGLAFAALGVFVVIQGGAVAGAQTYARVGPEVFPRAVGVGLALIGLLLTLDALRRRWRVEWAAPLALPASPQDTLRLMGRVALMAVGLALSVLLMRPLGFVVATTTLFLCVTVAFGSRSVLRDFAIALAFTATVFLAFTLGLGLYLPAGRLWSF
ncbi:MAG TPA: tripartite tricarboxylate transporter TctB family protein [Hyphomicrobiaceae bacterium]|nr:tripartite tricarboxylate transporter TctB family protein [Hyphomicrobiaceae bacterium]